MIDYKAAETAFWDYLQAYEQTDPKIRLKIEHTFGVVRAMEMLADEKQLPDEDRELAKVIALLHDIGRFEQLRLYHTFDDRVMPHAKCSIDLLFGQGLIRRFVKDPAFDAIILTAIENHGTYRLVKGLEGRSLLHACLIRDADKLDNYRVKLQDTVETMLDISAIELGKEAISDAVFQYFMDEKPIVNENRVTHMDMWVSYIGYIFDINDPVSFAALERMNTVSQMVDRIPYSNYETAVRVEKIRQKANAYVQSHKK